MSQITAPDRSRHFSPPSYWRCCRLPLPGSPARARTSPISSSEIALRRPSPGDPAHKLQLDGLPAVSQDQLAHPRVELSRHLRAHPLAGEAVARVEGLD